MKFLALTAFAACASALVDKCHKIPIGGPKRYTSPRTIANGNNQPAAISFLITKRGELMEVLSAGQKSNLNGLIFNRMMTMSTFADATEDPYMGQVFTGLRREFRDLVGDGEVAAQEKGEEYAGLFRDNTQRLQTVLRDIAFNTFLMDKIAANTDFTIPLKEYAEANAAELGEVYVNFVGAHIERFVPWIKAQYSELDAIRTKGAKKLEKIFIDEKMKAKYRQMINELPLVYQFFNDNIDFIEINNVDKSLQDAIAHDILMVIADEAQDEQVKSMINRHKKFIKKLMTHRATQQQKEKAVAKVMEQNKALREAAYDEEEFNRLKQVAMKEGKQLTKELEKQIWDEVKAEAKSKQKVEKFNQMENKKPAKKQQPLGRYEHMVGILSLMPDELLNTIAAMVKESCPELNLITIDTEEMKQVFEDQPVNFIDQLLGELHDVCDMFGLIDETKIVKVMSGGVEIEMYAADWMKGEKVQW